MPHRSKRIGRTLEGEERARFDSFSSSRMTNNRWRGGWCRAAGVAEGEAPRLRSCTPTQARARIHARIYLRHVRLSREGSHTSLFSNCEFVRFRRLEKYERNLSFLIDSHWALLLCMYISLSLSLSPRPIYLHPFLGIFFISSVALFPIPIFPISISPFQSLSLSLSRTYTRAVPSIHPSIPPPLYSRPVSLIVAPPFVRTSNNSYWKSLIHE